MGAVAGIVLMAVVICAIEVPSLLRKKDKKELVVFSILLLIGVGLSVMKSLGMKIPNPLDLIRFIFEPLSKWIYKLFQ